MREIIKLRRRASESALILGVVEEWMRKADAPQPLIDRIEKSKKSLLKAIKQSFKPKGKKTTGTNPDFYLFLIVSAIGRNPPRRSSRRQR
jgi:hypothetical protein